MPLQFLVAVLLHENGYAVTALTREVSGDVPFKLIFADSSDMELLKQALEEQMQWTFKRISEPHPELGRVLTETMVRKIVSNSLRTQRSLQRDLEKLA